MNLNKSLSTWNLQLFLLRLLFPAFIYFIFIFFLYCLRQLYYIRRSTVYFPHNCLFTPVFGHKKAKWFDCIAIMWKKSSNMLSLTFTSYNFELTFKMSSNKVSITNPISRDQEAFSILWEFYTILTLLWNGTILDDFCLSRPKNSPLISFLKRQECCCVRAVPLCSWVTWEFQMGATNEVKNQTL